jgi:hypothetical protein
MLKVNCDKDKFKFFGFNFRVDIIQTNYSFYEFSFLNHSNEKVPFALT